MKLSKTVIFLVGLFLVVAVLWWVQRPSEAPLPLQEIVKKEKTRPVDTKKAAPLKEQEPSLQEKSLAIAREEMVDIVFYGKVVDENENAVAGAEIKFAVHDLSKSARTEYQTVSDANGLFSLTGIQGRWMGINLSKDGYYTPVKENRSYEYYNRFAKIAEPDLDNPVVFHLRKKGDAEAMIHLEKQVPIQLNTPVTVDLKIGKIGSADGQLQVTLLENQGKLKQWSMVLTMNQGGIIPAMEEFPTIAPEDGYSSAVTLDIDSQLPPSWIGVYKGGRFYVRLQEGYGLIEVKMVPGGEYFRLTTYFNPSGSSNLAYDPVKQIKPERIAAVGLERAIEEVRQRRPKTPEEEAEEIRRWEGKPMDNAPE